MHGAKTKMFNMFRILLTSKQPESYHQHLSCNQRPTLIYDRLFHITYNHTTSLRLFVKQNSQLPAPEDLHERPFEAFHTESATTARSDS